MTHEQTIYRTLNVIDLIALFIEQTEPAKLFEIANEGKIRRRSDWDGLAKRNSASNRKQFSWQTQQP